MHPWLAAFNLDYRRFGPLEAFARSERGRRVIEVVLSRDAVAAVVGAIDAAPERPPQPALDRYLLVALELDADDDGSQSACGWQHHPPGR